MTRSVFTSTYRNFLKLLISRRNDAGLSQRDVAALLSRPQSYVSKYERGERRLDIAELMEIADVLHFEIYEFIAELRLLNKNNP